MAGTLDFLLGGKTKKSTQFATLSVSAYYNSSVSNGGTKTASVTLATAVAPLNSHVEIRQIIHYKTSGNGGLSPSTALNFVRVNDAGTAVEMSANIYAVYVGEGNNNTEILKLVVEITEFE